MKRLFLSILVLLTAIAGKAQGIQFEHQLSWQEVKAKAKAENKYIYLDCITTWCGPCKIMNAKVFPLKEVGDYYNDKFISVKVQMDVTAADDDFVKKWYKDAEEILNEYGLMGFPTMLYFNPDGKPVHRIVGGKSAEDFLALSAQVFDPSKQYYTQMEQMEQTGKNDTAVLKKMAEKALAIYDKKNAGKYADLYLAKQPDLYTPANIAFMNNFTFNSKNVGFNIFYKEGKKVDKVLGEGTAARKVESIIISEEISPRTPKDRSLEPDWVTIKAEVAKKYPQLAEELIERMKQMTKH